MALGSFSSYSRRGIAEYIHGWDYEDNLSRAYQPYNWI